MAVPKHKASKMQTNTRSSNNSKAPKANISICPQCHGYKENHRVCKNCGYYDGEKKISVSEVKD